MTKTLLRCGLATVLGILTCSSTRASVLWDGDAAGGTGVFEGLETPNGTIGVATDPTLGKAFKIELNIYDGFAKQRCEVRGCNGFRMAENGTYYVGWKSKFSPLPTDPTQWEHIFQLHGYGITGALAPLRLDTPGDGTITMVYQDPGGVEHTIWAGAPLVIGTWNNFVLHLHPTTDEATGWVELWYNGAPQKLANGSTRYPAALWNGTYILPKWGIYRQGGVKGVGDHYLWRPRFGTTYNDVDPLVGATMNTSAIYQLQNEASGLVLNNQGSLTNGSKIIQWSSASTSDNLRWHFSNSGTTSGYYQIVSQKSGLDAVVQSASTASGAGIVQFQFGSADNDQWKPVLNSDGSYTFYNLHSGLVLEDPGNSTSTSTQMDQWTANGGSNQKWKLIQQ
jgi:hypothetical protein